MLDTHEVAGSIPAPPTKTSRKRDCQLKPLLLPSLQNLEWRTTPEDG
jgi:hypothetical protein